jgi:hypothetical protein
MHESLVLQPSGGRKPFAKAGERDFRVLVTHGLEYYNTLKQKVYPRVWSISWMKTTGYSSRRTPCCGTGKSSPGWINISARGHRNEPDMIKSATDEWPEKLEYNFVECHINA